MEATEQLTDWLNVKEFYHHKTKGLKTNGDFFREVISQILKDKTRTAVIRGGDGGLMAVFVNKNW